MYNWIEFRLQWESNLGLLHQQASYQALNPVYGWMEIRLQRESNLGLLHQQASYQGLKPVYGWMEIRLQRESYLGLLHQQASYQGSSCLSNDGALEKYHFASNKEERTQWAFDAKMTLHRRRCDVIFTSCACWEDKAKRMRALS